MPAKSETMSENSRSNFQSYLNNRIYPALGNYRMYEITPTMISPFLPFLQEEGLAHGTVEKLYVIIRLIFKMAFLGDLIENVYPRRQRKHETRRKCVSFRIKKKRRGRRCLNYLEEKSVENIIANTKFRCQNGFWLPYFTILKNHIHFWAFTNSVYTHSALSAYAANPQRTFNTLPTHSNALEVCCASFICTHSFAKPMPFCSFNFDYLPR